MIQSQAELERSLLNANADRIRARFEYKEDKGMAGDNEYAQPIYRRWVLSLKNYIESHLTEQLSKAGKRQAHVPLLKMLDPLTAAYVAVRTVLVTVAAQGAVDARRLASQIGRSLYREVVLTVYEDIEPDLFYEVMNDLDARHSRSADHRYAALMGAARNAGLDSFPRWQQSDREQIGMWCVEALRVLGLVDVDQYKDITGAGRIKEVLSASMTPEAQRLMDRVKGLVIMNTPLHSPCIEPPKDWVAFNDGGWHSVEARRTMPFCVNIRRVRSTDLLDRIKASDLTQHVIPAINHLQRVRWKVNAGMLETMLDLAKSHLSLDEILTNDAPERPPKPDWLQPGMGKEVMSVSQQAEFKAWKRSVASWHTDSKLRVQRMSRFSTALKTAARYKDYEAIYFVYQADFRGRLYAQTVGIGPQGSDMQKALIHFADGKPLDTPEAIGWFKVNGANRYGIDKVPFAEQTAWVDENHKFILGFADDPVSNTGWTEADKPMQFLAWAKEYAAWVRNPGTFLSRIPVGLDGSCNGLQHFSAMLRDKVGGTATNLLHSERPHDVYRKVAERTQQKLEAMDLNTISERDRELRALWLKHGMNRSLVKRSVMTLPYGSTRFACAEFITKDYLRHGLAPEFEPSQYGAAANFLSHVVWASIKEVVIAASAAMAWLQSCASALIKSGQSQIEWTTPSGFPVAQVYNTMDIIRIRARLFGGVQLTVHKPTDEPRAAGHKNGLAPNFVHSMDASHLVLTVNACEAAGIQALAMIHDDYGTHAADTQKLFDLLRETFVRMYEQNDPIMDFYRSYDGLPEPPAKGELDIQEVRGSKFFFA